MEEKKVVISKDHNGVEYRYTMRETLSRLSNWYRDMDMVKGELLAGKAISSPYTTYYLEDWKKRSGRE